MPNWKKVILSGSNAELNAITMSGNIIPDSDNIYSLGASNNRFQLNGGTPVTVTGSGTQNFLARWNGATELQDSFIQSTDTLTTIQHSNDGNDIFIVSGSNGQQLTVTDAIGDEIFRVNDSSGLELFTVSGSGRLVAPNLVFRESDNFVLSYESSSGEISFKSASTADFDDLTNKPTLISSSNQFITITNPFTGSFTGSFTGDGANLTNISAEVTEQATITDTFTNATSKTVTHNFGTKNVLVSVYNNSDQLIIPSTVTTTDTNTVDVTLDTSTSGRVVVAKGGHLVSGSAVLSGTGVFSGSSQIDHDATTNFVANEHIDHSTITIGSGKGLSGGGTIDTNRSLSLHTGSTHFKNGITEATRYEENITGNTLYTITHNLDEDYPIVQVYDTNKLQVLPGTISASNANAVLLEFDSNFTGRVIVKK